MNFDDIKHLLPANYVDKPGTVIILDNAGKVVLTDNGDGTVSGFTLDSLGACPVCSYCKGSGYNPYPNHSTTVEPCPQCCSEDVQPLNIKYIDTDKITKNINKIAKPKSGGATDFNPIHEPNE